MYKRIFLLFSLIMVSAAFSVVSAQTPEIGITDSKAGGEVVSVTDTRITVKTKDGSIDAIISSATVFKKVSPINTRDITPAVFTDISAGDKVLVSGIVAADKKTVPAKTVYLLTKASITQRNAAEVEKWRTRGLTGKVVSVDPQTSQIGVEVRGMTSSTLVTVKPKEKAKIRRYAENSVDFNEAKASSLAEINKGDMFRAVGDRSADGTTFDAEELVTGAFQTVAGTVKSIDTAKNEVVITDFNTKKDLIIAVASSTTLKKIPAEMAQRLAAMQMGGGPGMQAQGSGPRPPGATPPSGAQAGAAPANGGSGAGAGPGRGMGGRGGIDDMLERFDTITVADIKAGDVIAASSTKTANAERITAIKLVSGVEPFLKIAQTAAAAPGGQRGQGGVNGSFTIPGLDGIGP
jgi:ribosomal protein L24